MPGSELMDVIWTQEENTVLNLKLKGVLSLQVIDENNLDTLTAMFRNSFVKNLVIKIKPVISISWGYNDQQ